MDITLFFAQIWGPLLLAVGIGIFVSRGYYTQLYTTLEKQTFATFIFGMFGTVAAIFQIGVHNAWENLPQVIVSLFGWMLLVKSLAMLIAPRLADRGGKWVVGANLMPLVGIVMLIVGGYLTWITYLA